MIPSLLLRALPYLLGALVIGGIYLGWQYHQREIGRQEIIAADAKAVAEQAQKDKGLSDMLVARLEGEKRALQASANQVREVIRYVPVTSSCGPAVGNAADWVRGSLAPQTGGPPAGR